MKIDLAAGTRLQHQFALELQGAAQQHGSGQYLAQHAAYSGRILVNGGDAAEGPHQAHGLAANIRLLEQEAAAFIVARVRAGLFVTGFVHGAIL